MSEKEQQGGLAHGDERDGAHDREAHASEEGVAHSAASLAVGFKRHLPVRTPALIPDATAPPKNRIRLQ